MKPVLTLLLLFAFFYTNGQDTLTSLEWMTGFGGTGDEGIYSATIDKDGAIYTAGWFDGTTDLDPGPGTRAFTAQSYGDIFVRNGFIQKSDSSGNFLWGHGFLCKGYLVVLDVAPAPDGSVLLGGFFFGKDSVDLDPHPTNTFYLQADTNANRSFMVKLNSQGQFQWAISQKGGTCKLIKTDVEGNIYMLGSFSSPFDTDPDPNVQNFVNPNTPGETDSYIQKLDSLGNLKWIKTLQGAGNTYVSALALNSHKDIVVSGFMEGVVNFDAGVSSQLRYPQADKNGFIFTMDSTGGFKSVNMLQGTSDSEIRDLEVDKYNNIYVAGWYNGTDVDFNPGSGTLPLQPGFDQGFFLMKTAETGTPLWVHTYDHYAPYGEFRREHLAIGEDLTTYFGGFLWSDMRFDPNNLNGFVLPINSITPYQIAYDSLGSLSWAKSYPHEERVFSRKTIVKGDYIFTIGSFEDTLNFDPSSTHPALIASGTSLDVYIVKQRLPRNCVNQDTTVQFTACDSLIAPNGITYYSSAQYTDSLLTKGKCDSLVHYDIQIELPPLTTVSLDTVVNQLSVPVGAENYQWISCDGDTLIPGATQNTYQVQIPGAYAVIITNGECADTSACTDSQGIGLAEILKESKISIYPNPTKGKLYLDADPRKIALVKVLDYSGRLIQTWPSKTTALDLSHFPIGAYILLAHYQGQLSAIQFVKED